MFWGKNKVDQKVRLQNMWPLLGLNKIESNTWIEKKFSIWISLSLLKTVTNVMHWGGGRYIWQEVKCLKCKSEQGKGRFVFVL